MRQPLLVGAAGAVAAAALAVEIPATKTIGALLIESLPAILREVAGIVAAVGVVYLGWSANRREKRDAVKLDAVRLAAESASEKVAEVAITAEGAAKLVAQVATTADEATRDTAAKLDGLALVADKTHSLVNSNMGTQLRISAVALRRIADLTNEGEDKNIADAAEALLAEHLAKQAQADARRPSVKEKA